MAEFEIIVSSGHRFRYSREAGYYWQFALADDDPEHPDKLDKRVVEVLKEDDVVKVYIGVVAVGDVDDCTTLEMPRMRMLYQCPRCGYAEYK